MVLPHFLGPTVLIIFFHCSPHLFWHAGHLWHSTPHHTTATPVFRLSTWGITCQMVRGRLEEALLIADEVPQHSGDEPLQHHRLRECKIRNMLTNLQISLLSPRSKHVFAKVGMHGLRIYLRAIPTK